MVFLTKRVGEPVSLLMAEFEVYAIWLIFLDKELGFYYYAIHQCGS